MWTCRSEDICGKVTDPVLVETTDKVPSVTRLRACHDSDLIIITGAS